MKPFDLFLNISETYTQDLSLFSKLGLKPFQTDNQEELFIGEYKFDEPDYPSDAYIKIFVRCQGAQIWRFEVLTIDGDKFEINCGSGALRDYWESVMKVANGCFQVKQIEK